MAVQKVQKICASSKNYFVSKDKRNKIAKKAKEEAKDNFLFDEELHKESAKYLGFNPYQE